MFSRGVQSFRRCVTDLAQAQTLLGTEAILNIFEHDGCPPSRDTDEVILPIELTWTSISAIGDFAGRAPGAGALRQFCAGKRLPDKVPADVSDVAELA